MINIYSSCKDDLEDIANYYETIGYKIIGDIHYYKAVTIGKRNFNKLYRLNMEFDNSIEDKYSIEPIFKLADLP